MSRGFIVLVVCRESGGWRVSHGKRRCGYYWGSFCLLGGLIILSYQSLRVMEIMVWELSLVCFARCAHWMVFERRARSMIGAYPYPTIKWRRLVLLIRRLQLFHVESGIVRSLYGMLVGMLVG